MKSTDPGQTNLDNILPLKLLKNPVKSYFNSYAPTDGCGQIFINAKFLH